VDIFVVLKQKTPCCGRNNAARSIDDIITRSVRV
jgi:hypothetical protein